MLESICKRKITYSNNLSVAQIKQVLKKIEYELKLIGDTVRKVENILHLLTLINAYNDTQTEDEYQVHYEILLLGQREIYLEFYNDILRYYDNIPIIEQKYKTLLTIHRTVINV